MTATAVKEYKTLLAQTAPRPIHTVEENDLAIQQLEELAGRGKLSAAEKQLIELLTVLIEAFEDEHYPLSRSASPVEVLQELMEVNGLKQKDLADVFATPSIVSEVIHGKRGLTTDHIKKLSQRFNVSPELFF
jgi:HTH-type transcriptional regulator / antitoxin HigA